MAICHNQWGRQISLMCCILICPLDKHFFFLSDNYLHLNIYEITLITRTHVMKEHNNEDTINTLIKEQTISYHIISFQRHDRYIST
jgi:hypothetical protein